MSFPVSRRWWHRANGHGKYAAQLALAIPFSPHKKFPFGLSCAPRTVIDAYRFAT